jgi:hypothetical protein
MEKNTKILIGVGAVIAAYLILKPKKATAQTSVVMPNNIPNDFPDISKILNSKKPTSPSNITSDLDITSLIRDIQPNDADSGSPYHSTTDSYQQYTYLDKEGNRVYKNVALYDKAGNEWFKTINDKNNIAANWSINYDINGKYISSYYDDGIRY